MKNSKKVTKSAGSKAPKQSTKELSEEQLAQVAAGAVDAFIWFNSAVGGHATSDVANYAVPPNPILV